MDKNVEILLKHLGSFNTKEITKLWAWNKILSNIDVSEWLYEEGLKAFEELKCEFDKMFNTK